MTQSTRDIHLHLNSRPDEHSSFLAAYQAIIQRADHVPYQTLHHFICIHATSLGRHPKELDHIAFLTGNILQSGAAVNENDLRTLVETIEKNHLFQSQNMAQLHRYINAIHFQKHEFMRADEEYRITYTTKNQMTPVKRLSI